MRRASELGATTLIFTVDMPVPGNRYRDLHSGMSGDAGPRRRMWQAMLHPRWAWDVGLFGRPHDLGNISAYRGHATGLEDYIGWLGSNFVWRGNPMTSLQTGSMQAGSVQTSEAPRT